MTKSYWLLKSEPDVWSIDQEKYDLAASFQ